MHPTRSAHRPATRDLHWPPHRPALCLPPGPPTRPRRRHPRLAEGLSPHSLRHAFATVYLDRGGNPRDLQDAMGHASPATTRRYDRDRQNLDRDAAYTVGAALARRAPVDDTNTEAL
ncbi:tyrosine-type recombinase/integrase [Parafrankia sp. Ea1.12]|uniref:tyrosine-type recombinase/integrase n=1 Tax=unclassified Parafrankia TaxID=2994368 RepID=UPI0034CE94B0